jgi:transcriptional regulator with XRE-family HTH domain
MMKVVPQARPEGAQVLAKAVVRAAKELELSQSEVAEILGTSTASMSRTWSGARSLEAASAEGRHALLFVRLFRSLDALVGGDAAKARLWLRAQNRHLGGAPLRMLTTTQGLVHVAEYLDAMRGKL